jgi:hypothetical protein
LKEEGSTTAAADIHAKFGGQQQGKIMEPRVFLSYRHAVVGDVAGAAQINAQHREWVKRFAEDLQGKHVDVIWDEKMRAAVRPHVSLDPDILPFTAELSRICPAICHACVASTG